MAILGGNPKMLARDISDGFVILNMANIRKYTNQDIHELFQNIMIVQREIRQEQVELKDVEAVKKKQMRLQRLFRAITTITTYAKPRKIPL